MLHIKEATPADIGLIREITYKVWPQTYSPILSREQITYMLDMMYSEASLHLQMKEQAHRFIICYDDDTACGFASYSHLKDSTYKLHKLYVLPSIQGKGAGKYILEEIYKEIRNKKGDTLTLNVNRHNPAINFYTKLGFTIIAEEDIDIGSGYFMNDFIMSLAIS